MSYHRTITPAHLDALRVEPADLRALSPHERFKLDLQRMDLRAKRRQAFWTMVQGAAGLLVLFGLVSRR